MTKNIRLPSGGLFYYIIFSFMKRRTQDGRTEYYDGKDDKERLRDTYLNVIDRTSGDLMEWVTKYVEGQDALESYSNIEQIKKELKRSIQKDGKQ